MTVNTSIAARILRVNHGGEHGAIFIYSTQIAVARWRAPDLIPFLKEALDHEQAHKARFRSLMPAREAKPCRLMWIWAGGGALLGLVTGLLGREAILACTEAVERTVHGHLTDQCRWARGRDPELLHAISQVQAEEEAHIAYAVNTRLGHGQAWLASLIGGVTEGLIWVSTRGDSRRLAGELAHLA
ncbi:demethoxyubiquinone hydroxylase family protein [Brevundimonas sp. 2R-24]|uniref:Demethoxyubiquinone hydroxylase family protein n=1 Tax=Peiella sedimenti TaxID=3061083 RepID=A0ABT8SNJ3_9CAUL|nr:demethoxyubiquinone hydroxylase family protein [Caulobacteraceae bacterium XZ-24]